MTEPQTPGPSSTAPWQLLLRVSGRAIATVAALVCLYYLAPLERPFDSRTIVGLCFSAGLLIGLLLLQVRAIIRSPMPGMRAIETVAVFGPLLIIFFAVTYFVMDASSFTEPLTRTDALYFALTVFSTVGFGDIAAVSQAGRAVVAVQIAVDLVAVGVGLRVILGAVQQGRRHVPEPGAGPSSGSDAEE